MRRNSCQPTVTGAVRRLSAYQKTLSVSLIATPRADFVTCSPAQTLSEVSERVRDGGFDFVPVESVGAIVAVLDMRTALNRGPEETVMSCCDPLAEKYLVGAETSILDFIEEAHEHPFRLLVTLQGISGLVSISDIQNLASRAALFALATQLEIIMTQLISQRFPGGEWRDLLDDPRLALAVSLWEAARESGRQVDLLNYTQFCDKAEILSSFISEEVGGVSKRQFSKKFERFRKLRDDLAHANEIEASEKTCNTVRSMRQWIEELETILS